MTTRVKNHVRLRENPTDLNRAIATMCHKTIPLKFVALAFVLVSHLAKGDDENAAIKPPKPPQDRTPEETRKAIEGFSIDGIRFGMPVQVVRKKFPHAISGPKTKNEILNVEVEEIIVKSDEKISVDTVKITFHDGKAVDIRIKYKPGQVEKKYKSNQQMLEAMARVFGQISDEDWEPNPRNFFAKWDLNALGLYAQIFKESDGIYLLFGDVSCEPKLPDRTEKFSARQVQKIQRMSIHRVSIGLTLQDFKRLHRNAELTKHDKSSGVLVETMAFTPHAFADLVEASFVENRVIEVRALTATPQQFLAMLNAFEGVFGSLNEKNGVKLEEGQKTTFIWDLTDTGRYAIVETIGKTAWFSYGEEKSEN